MPEFTPMPAPISPPQTYKTPLDFDFGQSPVGRFGNRNVQQVPARAPRSLGQTVDAFFLSLRRLGSRVLDIVTPHGVRSEGKYRRGLEATSARVGDLIGALSASASGSVDHVAANSILASLASTAEPVTRRGATLEKVFAQRVDVHLKNMTTPQLVALSLGLAQTSDTALKDAPKIFTLGTALERELHERLLAEAPRQMGPVLLKAMDPKLSAGAAYAQFRSLYGVAQKLLEAHGRPSSPKLMSELVTQGVNALLTTSTPPLDSPRFHSLLMVLPTEQLRDLRVTTTTIGSEAPSDMNRMLDEAVQLRAQQSEAAFMQGAQKLLERKGPVVDDRTGPLHAPQAFAKEVVELERHLRELRMHSKAHNLEIGAQVEDTAKQIPEQLNTLLKIAKPLIEDLNGSQLRDLSIALKQLGIEPAGAEAEDEITTRKEKSVAAFSETLRAVMNKGLSDVTVFLKGLEDAGKMADKATRIHTDLGERVEGEEGLLLFLEKLLTSALAEGVEPQQLLDQLNKPSVQALTSALTQIGTDLVLGGQQDAGKRLVDAHRTLLLLKTVLSTKLLVKAPVEEPAFKLDALDETGRDAVRTVFGVDISPTGSANVVAGVGSAAVQGIFETNLQEILKTPVKEHVLSEGGGSGVSEAFWLDLPRAEYNIRDAEGKTLRLLDRQNKAEHQSNEEERQLRTAVEKLLALSEENPLLLMTLSRVANQSLWAGLSMSLTSSNSPIRLPDSTPVALFGEQKITYTVGRDGDGGLVLRSDFSISRATRCMDWKGGIAFDLDPENNGHANFTVEVTIDPQGNARVSDPLRFEYDLKLQP